MTKKVLLVIGLYLCSMTVLAVAKDMSWSGWVSDSKCGVKGANAEHAACAKKCIAAGEKPVLVTDKDQKVVPIDNPEALTEHAGHHVEVTGKMTDSGTLHVDKVKMLAQKGGTGGAMNDMQH
ncbi:MAG TPA: hypothetical protein VII95_01215 [Terriglobales bacterium]